MYLDIMAEMSKVSIGQHITTLMPAVQKDHPEDDFQRTAVKVAANMNLNDIKSKIVLKVAITKMMRKKITNST